MFIVNFFFFFFPLLIWPRFIRVKFIRLDTDLSGFPDSSVSKESICNAGDPGSIPGSGRSAGEERLPTPVFLDFPCGSAGKESTCNAGDLGLIPGLGRSPREGKGYPLQYSGLENSMDTDLELICMQWKSHISFLSPHEYLTEYSYWEDCPFSVILQSLLRGKSSVQIRMQLCLDYFAWLVNLSSLSLKLYYFNYHRVKLSPAIL